MEKNLLKKSGIIAVIITFAAIGAGLGFAKLSLGAYNEKTLTRQFMAEDSKAFKTLVIEVGSDTVARIIAGTSSMTLTGTSSYQYQPRIQYSHVTGLWTFKNSGGTETVAFGTVSASYVATEIGSTTANYVLKNNGSSDGQLATNPTFAGLGTITASFGANGLVISPAELSMIDGATVPLNTATGSITNHTHAGADGTTQIAHDNITGTGSNSHAIIDNFIAREAVASGLATLDTNSKVVQNLASGTSTPGASKTVMSDGTGKILDGWLSNNVTKLGTPTTSNIPEGSNLYHTNARVNEAVGSLTINTLSDVNIIFNENDFVKIVGGQLVAGSSTVTVAFSEVTGSATASQLPLISNLVGSITTNQFSNTIGQFTLTQATTTTGLYNIAHTPDSYTELLIHPGVGSTTFHDISTNAFTLTSTGSPVGTQTNRPFDNASIYFNTGNYFTAPSNAVFDLTSTQDWCWEFWYKRDGTPANFSTLFARLDGSNGWAIMLNVGGANGIYLVRHEDSSGGISYTGMDGGLHHYAFVHNDFLDKLSLYVDNIEVATATASTAINWTNYAQPVYFGHSIFDGPRYAKGWMSEVRVSQKVKRYGDTSNIYTMTYKDPLNITRIKLTSGTQTASIIAFNGSSTIVGSLTSAYSSGTNTYKLLMDTGKGLAQDWVLTPSSSKVKTDLPGSPTTEVLSIVRSSEGHKFLYKDKLVSDAKVAVKALNDYIAEDEETEFELFREVYRNGYIEGKIGSQSVNVQKMKEDFSFIHANNKTVEWINTNIVVNKAARLKLAKAYMEMDGLDPRNNTANYGIEIDRNCPAEILDTNGLPSLAKWQGFNFVAIKGLVELVDKMKLELGSATAEIAQLKAISNP